MRAKLTSLMSWSALTALVASLFVAVPAEAYTLNPAEFKAGNIISDAQFFDENAMTEAEIQAFLNLKIGTCASGNPYCLNIYKQDTFTRAATVISPEIAGSPALCAQYTGAAQEPAARIIYKAQKACHISAKVLLVTLQKEQGLVTATNPTAGKLQIAMGYGCPDTAPCDAQYYGFYNQVYKAASQLKRYTSSASSFYRSKPAYSWVSIGYNPNSACGASSIYISNLATHALYIYTPYQPNAAALANLWGTGDGCSAYGNRNFWRNYNAWFNLKAELYSQVAALPATTKTALGSVVSDANCSETTNNCVISYQTGVATLPLMGSLSLSFGTIGSAYKNAGGSAGALGAIAADQETLTTTSGTGYRQKFANGWIYQTPAGTTFIVMNAMHDYYLSQGGVTGVLGWPQSIARCVSAKCDQSFDGGLVITNSIGQFTIVTGAIATALSAAGGVNSTWGLPTAVRQNVSTTSFGNGAKQIFQNGTVFEKSSTAVFVPSSLNAALAGVGDQAVLGWPMGSSTTSGTTVYQQFTAGWLFGSTANTTGIFLPNSMAAVWTANNAASGYLGLPTAPAQTALASGATSGTIVPFTGGAIIESSLGTFAQSSLIRAKYLAAGGPTSTYGWPTGHSTLGSGIWSQSFQLGTITASVPTPAPTVVIRPTIYQGSRGTHVVYLQRKLGITADGIFGPMTKAAVIRFQRSKGLVADGIVGPRTWAALG